MPSSASPNSTRPRSSRRFTIARARNSICLLDVVIGCAILSRARGINVLSVINEKPIAVDDGDRLRQSLVDECHDVIERLANRANAIAGAVPVRRLLADELPFAIAAARCWPE